MDDKYTYFMIATVLPILNFNDKLSHLRTMLNFTFICDHTFFSTSNSLTQYFSHTEYEYKYEERQCKLDTFTWCEYVYSVYVIVMNEICIWTMIKRSRFAYHSFDMLIIIELNFERRVLDIIPNRSHSFS